MPNVRQPVPNLIGGVSQQPAAARSLDQCEVMENAWPHPVDGLSKRPGTQHIAALESGLGVGHRFHFVDRSEDEQYVFRFEDGDIKAWDLPTGASRLVRDIPGGGFTYIASLPNDAERDLDILTVADYTFITNKRKVVAMAGTTSAAQPSNKAYIFVRQGNYESNYDITFKRAGLPATTIPTTVTWNGTGTYAAPALGVTPLNSIKTDDIAEQFRLEINNLTGATGVTANRQGSVIELDYPAGTFDYVEVTDSVGDSSMAVVHLEVPGVAGFLPTICRHGFRVKVVGSGEIDEDDYYVSFVADGGAGTFGKGYWQEDVGYSVPTTIDAATMPHVLIRRFDDGLGTITGTPGQAYFDYDVAPWATRIVGDATLVPNPDFIGRTIQDAGFHKERLVFLADDRVIFSETREPFNFFRTTLQALRDSAPFSITIEHSPAALLKQMVVYNERLLVKSERTQFVVTSTDVLSPRTVEVTAVSEYESDPLQDFVPAGRSVFFPFERGGQSGVREFFQLGDSLSYDAVDITIQTPNYIQGRIEWIAASTLEETLVLSGTLSNRLYVYKYIWSGQEKILSSWGAWEFAEDATVHAGFFADNTLYLVMTHSTGTPFIYLEKLELATGLTDAGTTWQTRLDRRVDESDLLMVYDAPSDTTAVTLPYQLAVAPAFVEKVTGVQFEVISSATNTATVRGDLTGIEVWAGVPYTMRYRFTTPYLKLPAGRGRVPVAGQRTVVRKLALSFADSGLFKVTTKVGRRTTYTTQLGGPEVTYGAVAVDAVEFQTGEASVGVRGRAEEVVVEILNEGPYPCKITSAEWILNTIPRATRLS